MCERYTIWEASEPKEIDLDIFRKCDPAYEGDSHKEFLEYLIENVAYSDEFLENETNIEILGEGFLNELVYMGEGDKKIYSDSRNHGANTWYDLGIPNDEFLRYGNFQAIESSIKE